MMSTQESRAQDELAWMPQKREFGITVAITMILAGETLTGQADFTHENVEGEDLDYRNMTIAWFEGNCELHNVSWNADDWLIGMAVAKHPLSTLEAVAEEFNFDVDYQEV